MLKGLLVLSMQGLEKTTAVLTLVLSTLQLRTEAPPGAEVIPMPSGPHGYGAFYLAPEGCRKDIRVSHLNA